MNTYLILRQLADIWAVLALFIFFVGTWVWPYRPGSRAMHDDAADVVFQNDGSPPRTKNDVNETTGPADQSWAITKPKRHPLAPLATTGTGSES